MPQSREVRAGGDRQQWQGVSPAKTVVQRNSTLATVPLDMTGFALWWLKTQDVSNRGLSTRIFKRFQTML